MNPQKINWKSNGKADLRGEGFLAEKFEKAELTRGEREFFGVEDTPEDHAASWVVNIRRSLYGPQNSDTIATHYGDPIFFPSREEAAAWIAENQPSDAEPYRCAHNESGRPEFTIHANP